MDGCKNIKSNLIFNAIRVVAFSKNITSNNFNLIVILRNKVKLIQMLRLPNIIPGCGEKKHGSETQ